MMYFRTPLKSYYMPDSATVYSKETEVDGEVVVKSEPLYSSLPCRMYSLSNTELDALFGESMQGRWKILAPLKHDDADVVIKYGYKMVVTHDGQTKNLRVEEVDIKSESHIEITAMDTDV